MAVSSVTLSKNQRIGIVLVLFGVASFALFLSQLNSYIATNSLATFAKQQSLSQLETLKNDPTQLASMGLTAADLASMSPALQTQIDSSITVVKAQADSLVMPMIIDFVLALGLCIGGIYVVNR